MTESSFFASVNVPSSLESIRSAEAFIVDTARTLRVSAASGPLFALAVHEALTNALEHGNRDLPDALIGCEVELANRWLTVRVFNAGPGFALTAVQSPDIDPDRVETLPEQGYGLPIIRSVFPSVRTLLREGRFGVEMAIAADEVAPQVS